MTSPLEAALRVEDRSAVERDGDRADREVAVGEVSVERVAAKTGHVGHRNVIAIDDPPSAEALREREGVAAELGRQRSRRNVLAGGDGNVEVLDRAIQGGGSNRPADHPGVGFAERLSGELDRFGRPDPGRYLLGAAHSAASRGTRDEIPQVIS